jgi:hypothetical protein
MQTVLLALALACPVGMGAMMWFMSRGMRRDSAAPRAPTTTSVEDLRAEQRRLAAEIDRLEDSEGPPAPVAGARG